MGETLDKNLFAMSEPFFGETQLLLVLEILITKIFEFASLEQIPDSLLEIEFWGRGW
jgi:hypothetical protein